MGCKKQPKKSAEVKYASLFVLKMEWFKPIGLTKTLEIGMVVRLADRHTRFSLLAYPVTAV